MMKNQLGTFHLLAENLYTIIFISFFLDTENRNSFIQINKKGPHFMMFRKQKALSGQENKLGCYIAYNLEKHITTPQKQSNEKPTCNQCPPRYQKHWYLHHNCQNSDLSRPYLRLPNSCLSDITCMLLQTESSL